jgi:hypothetical protein
VETTTTSSDSLEDWRDLSLSLLCSLTPQSTPTPLKKQLWIGGGNGMVELLASPPALWVLFIGKLMTKLPVWPNTKKMTKVR